MDNTEKGKAVTCQPFNQTDPNGMEETFHNDEARLRFALEAGQLGDWELDLVTFRATRSLQHDKIFGYETLLPEWTYEMFLQHLHPADRETVRTKCEEAITTLTELEFECRILRADGQVAWIWVRAMIHPDAQGQPARMLGVVRDITFRKQAEEDLQQSEARFRVLTEVMPQLVWSSDPVGNIDFCNSRWLEYTGLTAAEIWGDGWAQALHPDDKAATFAAWHQSVETGQEYQVEQRLCSATGEYRWFLTRALPYRDEGGQIVKWYGTCTDIQDRKQAEGALKASEREFRAIFELAGSGKAQADPITHQFTRVNRKFCEITGYSEEELLNMTFTDLTHPDDRPRDIELMSPALRGEQDNWQMEKRYIRKDGQVIWVIVVGSLVRDERGQPLRTIATVHDISVRKHVEEALARSERLYRAIGESINYGIWVCDPDGRNIYASESFLNLVGLTQEECSEFGWGSALHPDDAETTIAAWKACAQTGTFWEREHRFRGVDGRWHHLLARGVPIKDNEGQVLCWAGINLDITTLKQTEQALRESEERLRASEAQLRILNQTLEQRVAERTAELERSLKELDQFAYVASHDLKAPLRAVNHLASWIAQDAGELLPEPSQVHLAKMQSRIQRMDKLLNDLLIYSRAGRNYYNKVSNVDTGALVAEIVEMLAPPPGFTIIIQENMPVLRTYPILLELVFRNLIDNAFKHHHRADGQVTISARDLGNFVEFSIADNGPGIDEGYHDRVFQIFQTLRPRDEVEGSGVGLAIVKKAVETQKGVVRLSSTPGQGATFHFTWPKG